MSRDVRFVGAHTDFFRSASLYNTGPGHFINTWVTVYTIRAGLWVMLLLLLGGVAEGSGDIAAAIGAVQILQLGTLPLLSFVFNMWMENGLAYALRTLLRQLIAGGLLFHIFRSVTSAFHLARATLFGGAAYIATGRGFSLQRKTLTQVFINYGRSHMYLGLDVLCMSILILVAGAFVLQDTREFLAWLAGSSARGVSASWSEWHRGELAALRDDDGKQVPLYRFWSTSTLLLPRAVTCTLSVMVAVTSAKFETQIGLIMVDKVQTLVQFNDRYYTIWAAGQEGDLGDSSGGSGSVQGLLRRPARSASVGATEADKAKKA
eukprot:XP_001698666.1 glycosyl transferase [Chlamydomonas reinhardtii]